jgi:predicted ABC-class ATPase
MSCAGEDQGGVMDRLAQTLRRIDRKGYKAYKDLKGRYTFGDFDLIVDHVQGDPFASPSRMRVVIPIKTSGFPRRLFDNKSRKIAFCDFLTRSFMQAIRSTAKGSRGTGKSGLIAIDSPRQEVLDRTSCTISDTGIEIRFFVGLPAQGRTVLAGQAHAMLFQEIPQIVLESLYFKNTDRKALEDHVNICEDQDYIRTQLKEKSLVAFIADGAVLPRLSGIDERPLPPDRAIAFTSPASMRFEMETLHHGVISGTGIKEGVTLITGGGFHGKSTLLRAIERGVYNHIAGDGRELVITREDAVKIRSEDGRYVEQVNISPFINNLPGLQSTSAFSTDNASGSTSQASNIMEALEIGSRLLLIDEDTSATNFMIRDKRMQALVAKNKEPITPFVDKIKELFRDCACSCILVMGGSGDYFDVADCVVMMDTYIMHDVTVEAREIVKRYESKRIHEGGSRFGNIPSRMPDPLSFNAGRGRKEVRIDVKGMKKIIYGTTDIDLSCIEQIVDDSQTRAIADIIYYYAKHCTAAGINLAEGLDRIMNMIDEKGIDSVLVFNRPDSARPRKFEIGAALNRMRSLIIKVS